MGILKRVIVSPAVYPRFVKFLHVDIQSTGRTLSRPWLRQPNDVMSEIECAQLFIRRHSTRQSHGLFALAKHLLKVEPTDHGQCMKRELIRGSAAKPVVKS